MKRLFLLSLFTAFILSSYYIIDNTYYKDAIEFLQPLELDDLHIRKDRFGDGSFGSERKNGRIHKGLDILAPLGTPVRAAKAGWSIRRFDKDGYGKYVIVYHRGGLTTLYGHLEATNIRWVKKVRQGDIIGWVGKTGNARYRGIRPHLHFEVKVDGVPVDPLNGYLR